MSQCSEMVAPHGSYQAIFGTNPIAIGIPTNMSCPPLPSCILPCSANGANISDALEDNSVPLVLDMATSAYAWYGVVTAAEKNEPIPGDIGYDKDGRETSNPAGILLGGCLRSFDRSYKGSHLGLMVELLAGALTGASMSDKKSSKNWGTMVLCIHPQVLGDHAGFITRVKEMCERVKNAKKLPGGNPEVPIWLPGERGAMEWKQHVTQDTIDISTDLWNKLLEMRNKNV